MTVESSELFQAFSKLKVHDHACLIYETRAQQYQAVIPFLKIGLERGEKCVYILDEQSQAQIQKAFRKGGIPVEDAIRTGALSILSKHEAHLRSGKFDPDRMLQLLQQETECALSQGYSALRVSGENSWAAGHEPGNERLLEYEAKLNHLFTQNKILAICQYDRWRFSPEIILGILRTHPILIYGSSVLENLFYIPPEDFASENQPAHEIDQILTTLKTLKKKGRELARSEEELRRKKEAVEQEQIISQGLKEQTAALSKYAYSMEYLRLSDRSIKHISPSCELITGYRAEDFLHDPDLIDAIVHPQDRGKIKQHAKAAWKKTAGAQTHEAEYRILRKNEEVRWLHHHCQALLDKQGQLIGRYASDFDISAYRQAEAALQESEARFRLLIENAPEGIFAQTDGKIIYANPAAVRFFGAKNAEELLGQPVLERFDPQYHKIIQQRIKTLTREKFKVPTLEEIYLKMDGTPFDVEVSAVPYQWQGKDGSMAFFRDISDRKAAERKSTNEAARRRILMDQSRDGIVILNQEGEVYEANHRFAQMLGYSHEEIYKLQLWDWDARISKSSLKEMIRDVDEKGDFFETQHRRKDGSLIDVDISTNAATFEGQKLIFCICRDISDRKQTEAEILANNEYLNTLTKILQYQSENIQDFIDFSLEQGIKLTGSLFGYVYFYEEETQQFTLNSWIRNDEKRCSLNVPKAIHQLEKAGLLLETIRQRKIIVMNENSKKNCPIKRSLTIPVMIDKKIEAVVGLADKESDYSEINIMHLSLLMDAVQKVLQQRETLEALVTSEERYRTLFDQSIDGIYLHELNGKILDINQKACLQSGYSRDELLQMSVFDLHPRESRVISTKSEVLSQWKQWRVGNTQIFEAEHIRKDNTVYPIEIASTMIQYGEKNCILAIVRDITDRKQAAIALQEYSDHLEEMVAERTRELEQAQQELLIKERLATLGQLAGSVGHELRNPLGVISNVIYILEASFSPEEVQKHEYTRMIASQVQRSNKIISDLLNFAREPGTKKTQVDLPDLVAKLLKQNPAPKNVRVKSNLKQTLPPIFADPQHVEQVLINLLSNACQAMLKGGNLYINAQKKGEFVHLSIKDSGEGILPEHLEKLFTPLFTTKTTGIGLGLPISKKLMEANGGSIQVESQPNQGSTFTMILPTAEGENAR